MNYPQYIYPNYEIVEKDIYGKKHYGLVRVFKVLGVTFRKHVKVRESMLSSRGSISNYDGARWHSLKVTIETAIKSDNREREYRFEQRVTK